MDEGCANTDSYIASFVNSFWKDIDHSDNEDEEAAYDRYDDNPSDYVSDYAATNPAEDVAETMAHFVLEDKPTNCNATVADEKVCSLYNYSELVEMRDNIRSLVVTN